MSDAKSKREEQAFLKVTASDGTIHLLPYGHLLHVVLERDPDQTERLGIQGAISTVEIKGKELDKLLAGIQSLTLKSISQEDASGAKIGKIEVSIRDAGK